MARGKPGPSRLPGPRPIVTKRPRLTGQTTVLAKPGQSLRIRLEDKNLGVAFQKGPPGLERGSRKHINLSAHFVVTEQDLQGRPLSGDVSDSQRSRVVKAFYQALPDRRPLYADFTKEVAYTVPFITPSRPALIGRYRVPEARTLVIDSITFFATPAFGVGLVPPGIIEGYIQFVFKLAGSTPVSITNGRLPFGGDEAGFPFLNERVGATEVTFSLYATTGQDIELSYINRGVSPVPLATVGARMRGWLVETTMFEEIRQQQE
jgi:hypothetical protein